MVDVKDRLNRWLWRSEIYVRECLLLLLLLLLCNTASLFTVLCILFNLARGTLNFLIYSGVLFVLPCGLRSVNKGDAKCKCAMQNVIFVSELIGISAAEKRRCHDPKFIRPIGSGTSHGITCRHCYQLHSVGQSAKAQSTATGNLRESRMWSAL